jgi:hypothetical protein
LPWNDTVRRVGLAVRKEFPLIIGDLIMMMTCEFTESFRDCESPRIIWHPVAHEDQCQRVAFGKTECRREVLRCGCAWKSGAGIFLRPTGMPVVR